MFNTFSDSVPIIAPLFHHYPKCLRAYDDPESSYMLGSALKVSPVLVAGKATGEKHSVLFPKGSWLDLNDGITKLDVHNDEGAYFNLTVDHLSVNVH